jgi:hypothetical protein
MSPPPDLARARWARLRPFRRPIIFTLAYAAVRLAFSFFASIEGLVTPSGQPNLTAACLGLGALSLRFVVLFALPPLVAYQLVVALLRRLSGPADGAA